MKWTKNEKDQLLGFAIASEEENNTYLFQYISDMLFENGYTRTASQCKSMYYKLTVKLKK